MTTKKKPTTSKPKAPSEPFNFDEFNKLKSIYQSVYKLKQLLAETQEKFKNVDVSDDTEGQIVYLCSVLRNIALNTHNKTDAESIESLQREIHQKLLDKVNNLANDYNNREAILRFKLEDLNEQRKAYIERELKSIEDINNKQDSPEWHHLNNDEARDLLSKILGRGVQFRSKRTPNGPIMIFDENGIWFK